MQEVFWALFTLRISFKKLYVFLAISSSLCRTPGPTSAKNGIAGHALSAQTRLTSWACHTSPSSSSSAGYVIRV